MKRLFGCGFRGSLKTIFLSSAALIFSATSPAFSLKNMLIYGPTSGCHSDTAPGYNVTVWSIAQWAAATTSQFAAFDTIVFEDCNTGSPCFGSASVWDTAVANEAAWVPAVTGNIFIIGSDPDFHINTSGVPVSMLYQFLDFTANGSGTGLYVALSCVFGSAAANTPVPLLSGFGTFTVQGATSNAAHKISNHPSLNGVTDAILSNWNESVHEGFDSFDPSFQPLAIATSAGVINYTAPDGTQGIPYILARGVTFIPTPCGLPGNTCTPFPTPTSTPTDTPTETPTVTPTFTATLTPTISPTNTPTNSPTNTSTLSPTVTPTNSPTPTITMTFTPSCVPNVWPDPFNALYAVGNVLKIGCVPSGAAVNFYTLSGEKVRTVSNSAFIYGSPFTAIWDGKNENGIPVSSGIYFYVIQNGDKVLQRGKFVVMSGK